MKVKTTLWLSLLITLLGMNIVYAQNTFPLLEKYIKHQQFTKAFKQASKLRSKFEGDPRFDYLYGLSALQTGYYNEAVFALERVVVTTPKIIRPRLELARSYLKLNNKTAAIQEFETVLVLSPPAKVKEKVNAYLRELKNNKNQLVRKSVVKRSMTFAVGYDDNINFGFDDQLIDLPGLGIIKLNPTSIRQGSGFIESKLQFQQKKLRNRQQGTFVIANLRHRDYFKNGDFNLTDVDLRTGLLLYEKNRQYQFIVRDRPIFLGGKLYTNILGADVIASQGMGVGNILSASFSAEKYDHKKIALADRARAYLTVNYDTQTSNLQHRISSYLGKEWADEAGGKQFSRNIQGLGYKLTKNWDVNNKSYLSMDFRHYKHQAASAVSPEKRDDDRIIISSGHEWQTTDKTAIVFSARHIRNKSNVNLYDANRNELKIGVRYEWD
jgi:tetratricopeptide (TPR) repeat protein